MPKHLVPDSPQPTVGQTVHSVWALPLLALSVSACGLFTRVDENATWACRDAKEGANDAAAADGRPAFDGPSFWTDCCARHGVTVVDTHVYACGTVGLVPLEH